MSWRLPGSAVLLGSRAWLPTVLLCCSLGGAPRPAAAQAQLDKTGVGGTTAGQSLPDTDVVPTYAIVVGAIIAVVVGVAIESASSKSSSTSGAGAVSATGTATTTTR